MKEINRVWYPWWAGETKILYEKKLEKKTTTGKDAYGTFPPLNFL
jgi:hypothetical protein